MLKNCILLKMSSFKDNFQGFAVFGHWSNTSLAKHLLMTVSLYSRFVNVGTALFLDQAKNSPIY